MISFTEAAGFVTGAVCVWLAVRENVWNFPIGIANNVCFLFLFSRAKLYGDAGLQVVYIALAFRGWYQWLAGGERRTRLRVSRAGARVLAVVGVFVPVGTILLIWLLRLAGGSAPVMDAFTTSLSLAAQYLLNRKIIENWIIWIVADVIYIVLYIQRDLHLTAVLYFVFLCLCVAGYRAWNRSDEARTNRREILSSASRAQAPH